MVAEEGSAAMKKSDVPALYDVLYDVRSLMHQVTAPGEFAPWIAPPRIGINNQPREFPYVKL